MKWHEGIAKTKTKAKAQGRYKGRVPTARRQATEIIRLKEAGVRPSEIASRLGIGRASFIGCWVSRRLAARMQREAKGQRAQRFGSSGVPQLLGSILADMP